MKRPPKRPPTDPEDFDFLAELSKRYAERTVATIEIPKSFAKRAKRIRERLALIGMRAPHEALDGNALLLVLLGSALETAERLALGEPPPEELRVLAAIIRQAGRRRAE